MGEISYISSITNVEEKFPIMTGVPSHRSCDIMLLDPATELEHVNVLKKVKTGRALW